MSDLDVVDFHTHYRPVWWEERGLGAARPANPRLDDPERLAEETEANGIALRALSAPTELLFGPGRDVPTPAVNAVNDYLRAAVEAHPRFLGLATVDACSGDAGGEQAAYAIEQLGLNGLVFDSSRYGRYAGSPEARPALEVAARNGVPVFVHPVFLDGADLHEQVAGGPGRSLGRGFQNGISLLSLLHSGVFRELPELHVVVTALGTGSLLLAAEQIEEHRAQGPLNLYIDTMRFHPPTLRYLVDVLGEERVLVGTDWPMRTDGTGPTIRGALAEAGLTARQQRAIASGNARRLFARTHALAQAT